MRAINKELNNSIILRAAERIAMRLGIEAALYESWVQRWRERHGIKYVKPHGESADCPDFSEWLVAIQPTLAKYHPRDIYNMNETALFWRMSSGQTFVGPHEEKIRGRKANKSRVTILVGCSMDGEKLPLLCIGTGAKPRWPIVQGKRAAAPELCISKKGWMIIRLFSTIPKEFNSKLKTRESLMFVNNYPSHNGFLDIMMELSLV